MATVRMVVVEAPQWAAQREVHLYPMQKFGAWFACAEVPGAEVHDRWTHIALCAPMKLDLWPDLENLGEVEQWETPEMKSEIEEFFGRKFSN